MKSSESHAPLQTSYPTLAGMIGIGYALIFEIAFMLDPLFFGESGCSSTIHCEIESCVRRNSHFRRICHDACPTIGATMVSTQSIMLVLDMLLSIIVDVKHWQ